MRTEAPSVLASAVASSLLASAVAPSLLASADVTRSPHRSASQPTGRLAGTSGPPSRHPRLGFRRDKQRSTRVFTPRSHKSEATLGLGVRMDLLAWIVVAALATVTAVWIVRRFIAENRKIESILRDFDRD